MRMAWFLACLGLLCLTVNSPANEEGADVAAMKRFVPLYTRYIDAIQYQNGKTLNSLTSSDFVLKMDKSYRGQMGVDELNKRIYGTGGTWTITLRHIALHPNTAFVLTRESVATKTSANMTVTFSYYWKQTWHKSGSDWKLAVFEKDKRGESDVSSPVSITLHPTPQK